MRGFSKALIKWYKVNKRDLPWRSTHEPYKIWLSEIILQQTRVDQGMSYYHRFLELFPTVNDLAKAPEDKVLKAWQGLGYYSRARNLHETARLIVKEGAGIFPQSAEGLLKLKGVGPYTAAAIASFCYGEISPVIDGNVIRVLSRLSGMEEEVDSSIGKKKIQDLAASLIDRDNPGIYNQAIMEFGAIQCVPKNPDCTHCIFRTECVAFRNDAVSSIPLKAKKTEVRDIWFYYFYVREAKYLYIRKRTAQGIWKGLYDMPLIECAEPADEKKVLQKFMKEFGIPRGTRLGEVSDEYIHILSHRKIHAKFFEMKLESEWISRSDDFLRIPIKQLPAHGIPRLIEKFLHGRKELQRLWA